MLKELFKNYLNKLEMEANYKKNLANIKTCEEALKGKITWEERRLLKDTIKLCQRTNKYLEKKFKEF